MTAPEAGEKLVKVMALSDAIRRARGVVEREKTATAAQALQFLQAQRVELLALIPRPCLVVDNTQ